MGEILMADPALPAGFTLDAAPSAPSAAVPPPPAGFTMDPVSDGDYVGGLRSLLKPGANGKVDRKAVNDYIVAHHRAATGTTNAAYDYIDQGGDPSKIGIQDLGPQQGAPQPAQPDAAPQQQTMATAPDDAAGSTARGFAQGVLGGFGDKAGAFLDTIAPTGGALQSVWNGHDFGDAYDHNKAVEFAQSAADNEAHPYAYNGAQIAGAVASPLGKIGAGIKVAEGAGMAARVGANLLPAAAYGGIYGAGQSQADTVGGEALDAAKGAGLAAAGGAVVGGLARGAGAIAQGIADPVKQALYKAGTRFTPGQLMGGATQAFEDKLTSLPFTGAQINARLADSGQGWQTATLNDALKPYGTQIPEGMTGSAAFAHGQKAVDKAFDTARTGLQVAKTPEFNDGLTALQQRVTQGGVDALPKELQSRFGNVIKNNVLRKFNSDGVMSAQDYTKAASDIRQAARKQMAGNNPADLQDYGKALNDLADHLDTAALNNPASDPAAVAQLKSARDAYGKWALVQGAADRGGSTTAGAFTPTGYLQEVEKGDKTVRNHAFTEGNAFGQKWGQQGLDALGKRVPNSFTADRVFAGKMATEGLPMLATSMLHAGGAAQAASLAPIAADALGSIAYSRPVNALSNKLALGARPDIVSKVGKQLNAFAPKAALAGAGLGTLAIQHTTP
jgi:hypothetical protein